MTALSARHDDAAAPAGPTGRSLPHALWVGMRPRQWTKNVLVLAAPGAAGVLDHLHPALRALAAAGTFCLVSSGTYLVNDTVDAEADRLHHTKRHRPVASGDLPVTGALVAGLALLAAGIVCATLIAGARLAATAEIYTVVTMSYSFWLKRVPVVELACVASGFVLRAVAGGIAVHVPLSLWFLIVVSFGALLVVTGKRSAEITELAEHALKHRPVLAQYPVTFLRGTRLLAGTVAVTAYCVWAFARAAGSSAFGEAAAVHGAHHPIWYELSIVPFVLAVLTVELSIERGDGGAPEELALHHRGLQVLGLLWLVLFAMGVYAWPA